ncbi:Branchpoint-bridging protein [Plasmodiophora brassicae]
MTDPVEVSAPNSDDATARANGESSAAAGNDEEQRKPKRSRWGSASDVVEPKKRRSRWGSEVDKVPLTPEMAAATAAMSETQREVYLLRLRMQDITAKLANIKALIPNDPTLLSPSPPPEYDTHGKRTNTREQRIRDRLVKERNELIERSIKLNPQFAAPADFKKQRFVAKLMIPQDQPMTEDGQFSRPHSYCGMILGPRGLTQKRMQKETNCKIEIRGRGSQKEGRRHKPHPSDNEDLHVLITAENEADLSLCVSMIEKLLQPVNEDNNEHKARQLRELAAINGTLRDEIRCRLCGERGHFVDRCPERTGAAWNPAVVRCEICHDRGHITADCPTGGSVNTAERTRLKSEYENFMSELTGNPIPPADEPADQNPQDDASAPPPPAEPQTGAAPPPPPPGPAGWQPPPPAPSGQWPQYPPHGAYPPAPYPPPAAPYYGAYPPPPPPSHMPPMHQHWAPPHGQVYPPPPPPPAQ